MRIKPQKSARIFRHTGQQPVPHTNRLFMPLHTGLLEKWVISNNLNDETISPPPEESIVE